MVFTTDLSNSGITPAAFCGKVIPLPLILFTMQQIGYRGANRFQQAPVSRPALI